MLGLAAPRLLCLRQMHSTPKGTATAHRTRYMRDPCSLKDAQGCKKKCKECNVRNHISVGVERAYLHKLSIDHLHYGVALTLPCIACQRRTLSHAYVLSCAILPIFQED
jgi:hypothetical protein